MLCVYKPSIGAAQGRTPKVDLCPTPTPLPQQEHTKSHRQSVSGEVLLREVRP